MSGKRQDNDYLDCGKLMTTVEAFEPREAIGYFGIVLKGCIEAGKYDSGFPTMLDAVSKVEERDSPRWGLICSSYYWNDRRDLDPEYLGTHILLLDTGGKCLPLYRQGGCLAGVETASLEGYDTSNVPGSFISSLKHQAVLFPLLTNCFLACRNVEVITVAPDAKLEKRRKKKGKAPARPYKILNIAPLQVILRREGGATEPTGIKKALHICRGHFRDYTARGRYLVNTKVFSGVHST